MGLKEFVKEFLPNYQEIKAKSDKLGQNKPVREWMFDEYYFPQALEAFLNIACEAQKQKVSDCFKAFPLIAKGILEVEQPKITELTQPKFD